MQPYVMMIQTDSDDRDLTEATLAELANPIPVVFVPSPSHLDNEIAVSGPPAVILINDQGAMHQGPALVKLLKSKSIYSHIPIVVLGEVTSPDYIRQCYRAGANTFITKPSTVAGTRKKIETFFTYWFDVAEV